MLSHFRIILKGKEFLPHFFQIKLIIRLKKRGKLDLYLNEMKLEKNLFSQINELLIKFLLKKEEIENGDDGLRIIFKWK
jgi:hypothetical protein